MTFEFFLARKFLFGQRFGIFRLITTAIAVVGTALGVASLLVTLAVMDGFRKDIQEKILGTQPHIMVLSPMGAPLRPEPALLESIETLPGITAAAPYVSGQALLQADAKVTGIILRGVVPSREREVTRLEAILSEGHWSHLDKKGVVLGYELSKAVGARMGDSVTLVAPEREGPTLGQPPRTRRFNVVGIFRSGMYEYDANLAYLALPAAQDLMGIGTRVTGIGVRVQDVDQTLSITEQLNERLGLSFWTRSWQDLNRPLFSAMKLERTVMFIILTLIILVSSFTIISNLLLLTIEKAREIGILQALGASPNQIGRVFLINGLMLGGSGVGLGLILGVGLSLFLKHYPIIQLPADVYYIDRLPVRLTWSMLSSVAWSAFGLVLASVLYPARKARQMDPVQAIRHG